MIWRGIDDWLNAYDCKDIDAWTRATEARFRLRRPWAPPSLPEFEEDSDDRE